MSGLYTAKEVGSLSRAEGVAHTFSPSGQGEEVPGRNRDHVLDRTQEHVVAAVCNRSLVPVGAAPDEEGGSPCDSLVVRALHEAEGSNHDHVAEDDIPLSPLLMEVDTSRGGPCNH